LAAIFAASLARAQPVPAEDPRTLRDTAARIVRNLELDGQLQEDGTTRCGKISESVPCFPVSTVKRRPQWATSLRQSLGDLGPEESPSPSRPPTQTELQAHRPGPVGPIMILATFDPTCVGKSVLKRLKGKNDAYYLYRVMDTHGERVALYDHRLNAEVFQGGLEFLGRFGGECKALAAYRHEDRKASATVSPVPD
jgi:hypothetical protein